MRNHGAFKGTRSFAIIWIGQLVSLLGSQLTGFALGVWVYVETHSVLMLALTQVASQVPYVVLSPLAGVLADRWNRRTAMIVSDFGSGFAVLAAALFYFGGRLQPWMVIPINLWMAIFNSLMWPSYSAAITLLVPKEHYGRASGLMQLGDALPNVAGPAIAGALYVAVRLGNLALIDFATYLFSVILMVLFVRIPDVRRTEEDHSAKRSLWSEMKFGWDYIIERRGLFYLLLFFATINFISGIMWPLINPLILDNWKANVLGYIETAMGAGTLAGTLIMSVWGGGKRRIYTLFFSNYDRVQSGDLAVEGGARNTGACVRGEARDRLVYADHRSVVCRSPGRFSFQAGYVARRRTGSDSWTHLWSRTQPGSGTIDQCDWPASPGGILGGTDEPEHPPDRTRSSGSRGG
jgi:DHA3 family macrolide efflux protein-like MFS transporter